MEYSVKELTNKYETIWDQQDILFKELSYLNKKISNNEENNKIKKDVYAINKMLTNVDKKLNDIIIYIDHIDKSKFNKKDEKKTYYMSIFFGIIVLYYFIFYVKASL